MNDANYWGRLDAWNNSQLDQDIQSSTFQQESIIPGLYLSQQRECSFRQSKSDSLSSEVSTGVTYIESYPPRISLHIQPFCEINRFFFIQGLSRTSRLLTRFTLNIIQQSASSLRFDVPSPFPLTFGFRHMYRIFSSLFYDLDSRQLEIARR